MREPPHRLVESLEDRFQQLETDFHLAYWDSQVDATPESERRRAELELELRAVKGDPDALHAVNEALSDTIHEPLLRRQLEVLRLSLTGNQMSDAQRAAIVDLSSAVESDFASYRPQLDGRDLSDNEIEDILKSSNDSEVRRAAWESSKEIGAVVAERVRELARARNEVARALGFADYYRMELALQEIEEDWLFEVLDRLADHTEDPFRAWKQELDGNLAARFGTSELYPWHYADPFFQSLPPDGRVELDGLLSDRGAVDLARETFHAWGVDLSSVIEHSDLYPGPRKSQHAFCLDVDRRGDVRILTNIVPGERWVEVMLHESGHAAYDVSIDRRLPYLLRRPAHTFVTEAIAILSGRLVRDPRWLVGFAGLGSEEVDGIGAQLARASSAQTLLFLRWGLVMVHFERDLYSDPEGDLDERWWELVERFQLLRPPPDRRSPDWAAKIHIAAAPVYYHNYILGEMLASQLEATCRDRFGGLVGVPEAGELLKQRVFKLGASMRWNELVEHATGHPLSPDDFARALRA